MDLCLPLSSISVLNDPIELGVYPGNGKFLRTGSVQEYAMNTTYRCLYNLATREQNPC